MKIVRSDKTNKISPSPTTTITEFLMNEAGISGAVAEINGRYPESGFALNEVCKELVYVISGSGKLVSEKEELPFETGDVLYIDTNERFYWEGNFKIFMATSPKFDPNQHKIVK